ncbi:MAG: GH92 family glycosyl hydrolase [Rikenellaceae bacterium]
MKLSSIVIGCFAISGIFSCATTEVAEIADYTQFVNPFIGTDGPGNTYPGAQVPFGMVQLSPDNGIGGWDRIAGYFYPDSTIGSFSMTHLSGTGAGDLYDLAFMPVMNPYKDGRVEAAAKGEQVKSATQGQIGVYSTFSHDDEFATAGYYSVLLKDYNIFVELTATERCGMQRYTFKDAGDATVFFDLNRALNWDFTMDTKMEVIDSVTISGYRFSKGWANDQRLYYVAKFSKPFDFEKITDRQIMLKGEEVGVGIAAKLNYKVAADEQITVKCAISAVSEANALANLNAEMAEWDFEAVRANAKCAWNKELSKIEVESNDIDQKTIFYTAMYQSMLAPTVYQDVNGEYRGADLEVHKAEGFTNYTRFSLWDTYRAAHPLYTITQPDRVNDMVKSFLVFYKQHGRLPVWNFQGQETDMMIAYHSVPVIVDAYLKGIGNFDAEEALAACVGTANFDSYRGIGDYKKLGYMPTTEHESVSKTLEYAYDDFCIARMAEKMGKKDIADEFYKRSQYFRGNFNPESLWFEPRDEKGNWLGNFDPDAYTKHFTESNAWHYFFYVPQDVEGLKELMGGEEIFRTRLDDMFTKGPHADEKLPIFSTGMIGQYAHGNEPSHHVAYLYNWTKEPWKTQKYVREITTTQYANKPFGHCGNEDCGQMSSWFIFSSLGFYPVDPVAGVYDLGSPLFSYAKINLPNSKTFVVEAENNSPENMYVQSVTLNGQPLEGLTIKHSDIMAGGTLKFVMTNTPAK